MESKRCGEEKGEAKRDDGAERPRRSASTAELRLERAIEILRGAMGFCRTSAFLEPLERFVSANSPAFSAHRPGDDHALLFTELFEEYCALFDASLGAMLCAAGVSADRFFAALRRIRESTSSTVRADEREFVGMMLASSEYEVFVEVMRREAPP